MDDISSKFTDEVRELVTKEVVKHLGNIYETLEGIQKCLEQMSKLDKELVKSVTKLKSDIDSTL